MYDSGDITWIVDTGQGTQRVTLRSNLLAFFHHRCLGSRKMFTKVGVRCLLQYSQSLGGIRADVVILVPGKVHKTSCESLSQHKDRPPLSVVQLMGNPCDVLPFYSKQIGVIEPLVWPSPPPTRHILFEGIKTCAYNIKIVTICNYLKT